MTFDHRSGTHLEIDGARLYHEVIGTRGAPPLVLLHGGFGTIEDFNGIVGPLLERFEIIGIDSRGQGASTLGPERLTYARLQADVEHVLDRLGVEHPSVIGHSDGGIVAYRIASMTTRTLERLVTVSARWHVRQAERTRDVFVATTGDRQRRDKPETFEAYRRCNPEPDFDRLAKALVAMWLDPETTGHPDERVASIACPLLIVRGDDDELLTRRAVVDLADRLDQASLLNVPFARHLAFVDQPAIFSLALDRFLERR